MRKNAPRKPASALIEDLLSMNRECMHTRYVPADRLPADTESERKGSSQLSSLFLGLRRSTSLQDRRLSFRDRSRSRHVRRTQARANVRLLLRLSWRPNPQKMRHARDRCPRPKSKASAAWGDIRGCHWQTRL